jgi:LPS-assembly lipoprotein
MLALSSASALGLVLSGCGFRPLYGRRGSGPAALEMAAVEIGLVRDRLDQNLRNDLIERLTPFGEPAQPRYGLSIQTSQSNSALAIQSDSTITRFNVTVSAAFTLTERASGRILYRGNARAIGSYDAIRSDFATLTAEKDSARRTVREVSEDIRAQLAAFFARNLAGGR